ncbi:MAG TPA: DegT/DnrJ/EryC1/StrS family aminotransferase [Chitinophagales bacterium]|nr:DegT/DnrJ/EryC1/StrS family aminotransferase [Chitinophagales bacterium]
MRVPFVDLYAQYESIRAEIDASIQNCINTASFIGGEAVRKFELEFASFLGVKHCIGCGNGTDSLEILLKTLGIGAGDEVLVPAMSWISTSEAVSAAGAVPVFVDVLPDYYTINPAKIEEKITVRTKAILPVHLYGLPAEMDEIMRIAKKHGLKVLEDCAQSHGAIYRGRMTGTFGDAASFSFYPGKNLGAYGDGGGMVTNNDEFALFARRYANHGGIKKHEHEMEGRNSRLDAIQAAVLSVKLKYLPLWTEKRRGVANWYRKYLEKTNVVLPQCPDYSQHVYHLFVVRVKNRERALNELHQRGIQAALHYPVALPFLKAYSRFGCKKSDFPVAAAMQEEIISLPMYAELTEDMVKYVAEQLLKIITRE